MSAHRIRRNSFFRCISLVQAAVFFSTSFILPATTYAQSVMELPVPGQMLNVSDAYVPVMLRAVKVHPDQPLVFDFIVDSGNTQADQAMLKAETRKLVKYFLAALTIPEKDLWVNLSPYEQDRIAAESFGQTQMGRDLLAQDYVLKQLSASMIYPETTLGKEFWSRVYAKAREVLGSADLPANAFNKVWIMPESATVYEVNGTAVVGASHLKVMMEQDYLSRRMNAGTEGVNTDIAAASAQVSADAMRQVILPEIEKEVNTGKNFALLRQVYQALILAAWYKKNLKESLLSQVYADQGKVAGVAAEDASDKEKIYERYVAAYKEGVFNYIKEDTDPVTQATVPRQYFSGGVDLAQVTATVGVHKVADAAQIPGAAQVSTGELNQVTVAVIQADMAEDNASVPTMSTDVNVFADKLRLAEFDKGYLEGLFAKYVWMKKNPGQEKQLIIDKNFLPSARMTPEDRDKFLGAKDYKTQVRLQENLAAAKSVVLWADEMNGGLGTSVARERYLKEQLGRDKIGAKGTDLYFFLDLSGVDENGDPVVVTKVPVSTTELKYLQVLHTAGDYGKVIMQELVNSESLEPMQKFLNETIYLRDRLNGQLPQLAKRTYRQVLAENNIEIPAEIVQASLPVIDIATDSMTDEFLAPGGHGQLGSMVLQDALTAKLPEGQILIRTVYNGDGTNNAPDPYIVGWMADKKVPIVMISTTKTALDKKGGLIGGEKLAQGGYVTDMLELGQVRGDDQKKIFAEMGLTTGEPGGQLFNTNIALVNYSVLQPFLKELYDIIGPNKFAQIVTPDLILNEKLKGPEKKKVIQLEGAMGSALLNINRFAVTTEDPQVRGLMKKYGFERLLYVVNADTDERETFFTPVKYAWDHWLYADSGYFRIDTATWRLVNNNPGSLPGFGSMDKYYEDVQNVMDAFGHANVDALKEISIKGVVKFEDAILRGKVLIENNTGSEVDLNEHKKDFLLMPDGKIILEDVHVVVNEQGDVTVSTIDAAQSLLENVADAPEPADAAAVTSLAIFQHDFLKNAREGRAVYAMIKPDGVKNKEAIFQEYRDAGFDVITAPAMVLTSEQAKEFYDVHAGKAFFQELVDYISGEGQVIPVFLTLKSGNNAVEKLRALMKDVIRPRFGVPGDLMRNATHGSDSPEHAVLEARRVFGWLNASVVTGRDAGLSQAILPQIAASQDLGGIDFDLAALNLKIERTNEAVTVKVDPAVIERIKAEGVAGFTPVIVNIMPVKTILQ